jgi:hypothetical protein
MPHFFQSLQNKHFKLCRVHLPSSPMAKTLLHGRQMIFPAAIVPQHNYQQCSTADTVVSPEVIFQKCIQ